MKKTQWSSIGREIKEINISAIMLAFFIVVSFFSNRYFKLNFLASFLSLDIALVFLIPLVFITKIRWWLFVAIVAGLATFAFGGNSGYIGPLFNVFVNVATLVCAWLLKKTFLKNHQKLSKKSIRIRLFIICLLTFIIITFFNIIINGLLFTPLYFYYFSLIKTISFSEAEAEYVNKIKPAFAIKLSTYWGMIFVIYGIFNVLKFGLVLSLVFSILILFYTTKFVTKYFTLY